MCVIVEMNYNCYLCDTCSCEFMLLSFVGMDLVISVDVVITSCCVSCWPGHWYLSQGLAHVQLVVLRSVLSYSILRTDWVEV